MTSRLATAFNKCMVDIVTLLGNNDLLNYARAYTVLSPNDPIEQFSNGITSDQRAGIMAGDHGAIFDHLCNLIAHHGSKHHAEIAEDIYAGLPEESVVEISKLLRVLVRLSDKYNK
jgi:hypothetical protein